MSNASHSQPIDLSSPDWDCTTDPSILIGAKVTAYAAWCACKATWIALDDRTPPEIVELALTAERAAWEVYSALAGEIRS